VICGGNLNEITNTSYGMIGGGSTNVITEGNYSSILGGASGYITSTFRASTVNVVTGGEKNGILDSRGCVVSGGTENVIDSADNAFIGGGVGNKIINAARATIGGGNLNEIQTELAFIGGGERNRCLGVLGSIGGGIRNTCSSQSISSGILGGELNHIEGNHNVIGGGMSNTHTTMGGNYCNLGFIGSGLSNTINPASTGMNGVLYSAVVCGENNSTTDSSHSFIGGGQNNSITGASFGVIPGGVGNVCSGNGSFCAGQNANDNGNTNTFVWGDSNGMSATGPRMDNTLWVSGVGGTHFYSNNLRTSGAVLGPGSSTWLAPCDRNKKENIVDLDYSDTLDRLKRIPLYKYNYKGNPETLVCMGPMAQEWNPEFPSSKDPLMVDTGDVVAVALASSKALLARVEEQDERIRKQDETIKILQRSLSLV
jgi:hypothetical protein